MRALLGRLLGGRAAADVADAWQETWVSIWKAMPRLKPGADPWPFIRQAAVRKAIDVVRSRPRAERADVESFAASPPRETAPDLARNDALSALLSKDERICIQLFFWEQHSVREIAAALDAPVGTVKTWLFRARAKLRAHADECEGRA